MTDKKDISRVIDFVFESQRRNRENKHSSYFHEDSIQKAIEYIKKENIDNFSYLFMLEIDEFIESIIEQGTKNENAQFLLKNIFFVEQHIEFMIKEHEGNPCCADKTSFILSRLLHFFLTETEINLNYNQEYTFHLPKKVLYNHELIMDFYQGLKSLFYGNPKKYLESLVTMNNLKK